MNKEFIQGSSSMDVIRCDLCRKDLKYSRNWIKTSDTKAICGKCYCSMLEPDGFNHGPLSE